MKLTELIPSVQIVSHMKARDLRGALGELLKCVATIYTAMHKEELVELTEKLLEREELGSTALGNGVAVPHTYHGRFRHLVAAFGRSEQGMDFGEDDKVHAVFLLLFPEDRKDVQMLTLSIVSKVAQSPGFLEGLLSCEDDEEIHELLGELDQAGRHGHTEN